MQLLCTLRTHCRQWPRNTRYQAGRYPLLGPDFHRLDRTSLRLAHSLDHLLVIVRLARRELVWINVTAQPVSIDFELRFLSTKTCRPETELADWP
jgi:hypothetical protein